MCISEMLCNRSVMQELPSTRMTDMMRVSMPWRSSQQPPKMFEIGLGCNMEYGPGASVQAWKTVLPKAELWEAEYDEKCVNKSREEGQLNGVSTVTGDQA